MKVTVYGGTNNSKYNEKVMKECEKLGKYLASIKAELLTGGCKGLPLYVGKAAIDGGAKVTGYSPAASKKEHAEVYGYPTDGVTDFVFLKNQGTNKAENFMRRSLDMAPVADVDIALGGSWGTYIEIMFSFYYKKTIILVEQFGGAVKMFEKTYDFFGANEINPAVHNGATLIRVRTVDDAILELGKIRAGKGSRR